MRKKLVIAVSLLLVGIIFSGCQTKKAEESAKEAYQQMESEDYEQLISDALDSYNKETKLPVGKEITSEKEDFKEIVVRYSDARKCYYVFLADRFDGTILKQKKEGSKEFEIVDGDYIEKELLNMPEVYVHSK